MASIGARPTPSKDDGQDRPVLFQKYFKTGHRTYACQIKLAKNGKRYLVVTEGYRDPETDEVKKHYVRVFDDDLKEFFSIMQETVLWLRANKDATAPESAGSTSPGKAEPKPAMKPGKAPAMKAPAPRRPALANAKVLPANGKNARPAKGIPARAAR